MDISILTTMLMEAIYIGNSSPDQIIKAAIQDAGIIGVSCYEIMDIITINNKKSKSLRLKSLVIDYYRQ
ncbi:MAG: hypothetical protein M1409_04655 [Actinobacteria bacterium]|nr:hypothetical protein [Actinomycetota bacterium]